MKQYTALHRLVGNGLATLLTVLAAIVLTPATSLAWGHLVTLGPNSPLRPGFLVFDAIERANIGYCIEIEDETVFSPADVELELRAALTLWLDAVADLLHGPVTLENDCNLATLDLSVLLGEAGDGAPAYFRTAVDNGNRRFVLFVDTADTRYPPTSRSDEMLFEWTSIFDLYDQDIAHEDKEILLSNLAKNQRSISDVAEALGIENISFVRHTLLNVLTHEIGHGFGLCDTNNLAYETRCDPAHRSEQVPGAIMFSPTTFFLTRDDRAGIRALFERFGEIPIGGGRIFGDDNRNATTAHDRALAAIVLRGFEAGGNQATNLQTGFFVGDCRTIVTARHGFVAPNGTNVPRDRIEIRPAWAFGDGGGGGGGDGGAGDASTALEIDWPATGDDTVDFSHLHPLVSVERDFMVLTLAAPATGCTPFVVDAGRAAAAVRNLGPFSVASIGGLGTNEAVSAATRLVQVSASCAIFPKPYTSRFNGDARVFLHDCDLDARGAGAPIFSSTIEGGIERRFLIGMNVGTTPLPQGQRLEVAYSLPGGDTVESHAQYRGAEGVFTGANIALGLSADFAQALNRSTPPR